MIRVIGLTSALYINSQSPAACRLVTENVRFKKKPKKLRDLAIIIVIIFLHKK